MDYTFDVLTIMIIFFIRFSFHGVSVIPDLRKISGFSNNFCVPIHISLIRLTDKNYQYNSHILISRSSFSPIH